VIYPEKGRKLYPQKENKRRKQTLKMGREIPFLRSVFILGKGERLIKTRHFRDREKTNP